MKKLDFVIIIFLSLTGIALLLAITISYKASLSNIGEASEVRGIVTNIWISQPNLIKLKDNKIKYLFVDIGDIGIDGKLLSNQKEILSFISLIREVEISDNYDFIIIPYTEIILDKYFLTEEFQNNFIKEHKNLINLGFNGVFVDIEKIPLNQRINFLNFLDRINRSIIEESILAVYAGHLDNNPNEWEWDIDLYKSAAETADIIVVPSYDTDYSNKEEYILGVSSKIEDLNNIKGFFILGLPTHKKYPETIENSLTAYKNSLKAGSNFIGTSVFAEWTMNEEDWKVYSRLMIYLPISD